MNIVKWITDAEWEEASEQFSINWYESGAYLEGGEQDVDDLYEYVCMYFSCDEVKVIGEDD